MMEYIFNTINTLIAQQLVIAAIAAFLWGIISVIVSPCHLGGIPLICGYLMKRSDNIKNAFFLSLLFSIGVFISILIIGAITISLGRIFGDVGYFGDLAVGLLFILFGLYLLGIINLNWNGFQYKSKNINMLNVFLIGFVFGMGLGPCTFAYIAPIIGFTFKMSASDIARPAVLMIFFAVGHTLTIAVAGISGNIIQKFLNFNESSNFLKIFQKTIGFVLVIVGINYLL